MKNNLDKEKHTLEKREKSKRRTITALSVALGAFAAATLGLSVAYGVSMKKEQNYSAQLENVYQKNLYDLVESVNNTETKLSKVLASDDKDFQNKTLVEVAHNTELAQQSISGLPISQGEISDSVSFINKVGGYTTTLAKKLAKGGSLTSEEKKTLFDIQTSIKGMKERINDFIFNNQEGYSILDESMNLIGDKNSFTIQISKIKDENLDYPTMIYDGPFSDSQTNIDIKGLKGEKVDQNEAYDSILKCFNGISEHEYEGEINSKIETYNFKLLTTTDHTLYAQVTKIGGNVITVSGTSGFVGMDNIDMDAAKDLAVSFAQINGIENPECVWSDVLENEAYLNIAPVVDGVILYPDLVKVKIDLTTGVVIGYDASTYFTNHTQRLLPRPTITTDDARNVLPDGYNFEEGRLVLAPLEYSREVLCYEFKGENEGDTYYFYINAQTGKEENILKVIETNDGAKLM